MGRGILLTLLALILTGCGALAAQQALPTPRPVATVTPISTPLTYPPTPIPVGNSENPLRWVFVPADAEAAAANRDALQAALSDALGVAVEIEFAAAMGEVIEQLCAPSLEQVTIGTVDVLGYAIVNARGCASPAVRLVTASAVGDEILIVTRQAESLEAARSLRLPFCRLSSVDLESWVLPTLLLRTLRREEALLTPTLDRRDYTEALRAVSEGACWGVAVPARVYNPLRTENDPLVQGMRVLERTPRLPFGIVMMPVSVPLDLRTNLIQWLEEQTRQNGEDAARVEATTDPEATPEVVTASLSSEVVRALFGEYRLMAVDASDLAAVDRFFNQAQLDFARLGR